MIKHLEQGDSMCWKFWNLSLFIMGFEI